MVAPQASIASTSIANSARCLGKPTHGVLTGDRERGLSGVGGGYHLIYAPHQDIYKEGREANLA
jgi:hypothetical protein